MSELRLLFQIALRNLFASFLNVVIGGIILVGTTLFVVGGSLLGSVDSAMSKSITASLAGNLQIYSDKSKDELALFGSWQTPDISPMTDFAAVKAPLMAVENIKAIVPMGVSGASVTYGNTVDQILERFRKAVGAKDRTRIESLKSHVRQMLRVIQADYQKYAVLSTKQAVDQDGLRDLAKASSNEFWGGFDRDPLGHLEFLENRIAQLVPDADFIYLGYVGTNLDQFKESFDRMEVVDGQMVPRGQRGMLLSKYVYEKEFKLLTAYRLDKIREAIEEEGKTIATDPDLRLLVKQNQTQLREFMLQLDPLDSKKAVSALQRFLKAEARPSGASLAREADALKEAALPKLLGSFFETTDSNFAERYKFFYAELAPLVELYRLKPGDFLPIKSFTKGGYMQSVNVKVYGTFRFKGLEKSGLAGGASLMDLMTFRDLYGYVTPEKLAESAALKKASGAAFVERENAEAELFGGSTVVGTDGQKKIDDQAQMGGVKYGNTAEALNSRVYSPDEIEKGVALNAAIILKDPSRLSRTQREIEALVKKENLNLRVVSWQKAAGNLGQFVFVAKFALYFSVFIIFVVALVIINNAVMMATLQRIREIGTMRAIGAQRSFVLSLVVIETLCLGLVFGLVGTVLGSAIVKWLGVKGIPAGNEFMYFFFSGPRLYATVGMGSLVGAFIIISIVTSVSALYPAIIATRVSPVRAMQSDD